MKSTKEGKFAHLYIEQQELEHILQRLGTDSYLYDYFRKAHEEIFRKGGMNG